MKKVLLGIVAFASFGVSAQTFTVDDTLSTGDSQTYFIADSSTSDLGSITGAGSTWDYSSLFTYANVSALDTIKNASDSPDFSGFPEADYHDDLESGASTYFSNFEDSIVSYGFTFNLDGNDGKLFYDVDPLTLRELPMTLGQSYSDSTYGSGEIYGSTGTGAGNAIITADGTGTLILGTTSFTNVIRIKHDEIIQALIQTGLGDVNGTIVRTIYSYYDLANQKVPIFIHSSLTASSVLFNGAETVVYSTVDLEGAEIEEGLSSNEVSLYPNPANNILSMLSPKNTSEIKIMNVMGQEITSIKNPSQNVSFNVSQYETGVYFVQFKKGQATITKKLIVE